MMFKILRVLTTNKCNFKCVFCHNEGQQRSDYGSYLTLDKFIAISKEFLKQGIEDVQFSGGEPFLNPDTIEMIEWLDKNTSVDIGCATNASLLTDVLFARLSNTRVSLNINFQGADNLDFRSTTGCDLFENICLKLKQLTDLNIDFKLNYVILPGQRSRTEKLIDFCLQNNYKLKLLPFITESGESEDYSSLKEYISQRGFSEFQLSQSASRWVHKTGDEIKFIYPPCQNKDINACKEYAEIRLLPALSLQTCLFEKEPVKIVGLSSINIIDAISEAAVKFECPNNL